MGASTSDICLTIIANGHKAYYAGVKGCGAVIWDLRSGLFDPVAPDPTRALDWIAKSTWDDSIEPLDAPLEHPIYGFTTIDFDTKRIVERNDYMPANLIFFDWLAFSIKDAIGGRRDGIVPGPSLSSHLTARRIQIRNSDAASDAPFVLPAQTISEAAQACERLLKQARAAQQPRPAFAALELPDGWALINEDAEDLLAAEQESLAIKTSESSTAPLEDVMQRYGLNDS